MNIPVSQVVLMRGNDQVQTSTHRLRAALEALPELLVVWVGKESGNSLLHAVEWQGLVLSGTETLGQGEEAYVGSQDV